MPLQLPRFFQQRRQQNADKAKKNETKKPVVEEFGKSSVRVVIYQDHDLKGRSLLYDSSNLKQTTRGDAAAGAGTGAGAGAGAGGGCCIKRGATAPAPGPTKPQTTPGAPVIGADIKLFAEMMFGSDPMTYKGSTLKVHHMRSPPKLMVTRVFRLTKPTNTSGEPESFDSLSYSSVSGVESTPLVATPARSNREKQGETGGSVPMDVPVPPPDCISGPYQEDSGIASSLTSSFSSNYSSLTPGGGGGGGAASSGDSSRQKRWRRNHTTSLEYCVNQRVSSGGTSSGDFSRQSIPVKKRPPKLGVAIVCGLPEDQEKSKHFLEFFFSHITLIEGHIHRLKLQVEKAVLSHPRFSAIVTEGVDQLRDSVWSLYSAHRLPQPVWLNMMSSPPGSKRHALCEDFITNFSLCVKELDTKQSRAFFSSVVTGVLTNHLAWVPTVTPVGATQSRTYLAKHTAKWVDTLARCHPYNPLWAQLGDLYGAIGFPLRLSRVVVTGKLTVVKRLLIVLSYFIRCSEMCENLDCTGSACNIIDDDPTQKSVAIEPSTANALSSSGRLKRSESSPSLSPTSTMSDTLTTEEESGHSVLKRLPSDNSKQLLIQRMLQSQTSEEFKKEAEGEERGTRNKRELIVRKKSERTESEVMSGDSEDDDDDTTEQGVHMNREERGVRKRERTVCEEMSEEEDNKTEQDVHKNRIVSDDDDSVNGDKEDKEEDVLINRTNRTQRTRTGTVVNVSESILSASDFLKQPLNLDETMQSERTVQSERIVPSERTMQSESLENLSSPRTVIVRAGSTVSNSKEQHRTLHTDFSSVMVRSMPEPDTLVGSQSGIFSEPQHRNNDDVFCSDDGGGNVVEGENTTRWCNQNRITSSITNSLKDTKCSIENAMDKKSVETKTSSTGAKLNAEEEEYSSMRPCRLSAVDIQETCRIETLRAVGRESTKEMFTSAFPLNLSEKPAANIRKSLSLDIKSAQALAATQELGSPNSELDAYLGPDVPLGKPDYLRLSSTDSTLLDDIPLPDLEQLNAVQLRRGVGLLSVKIDLPDEIEKNNQNGVLLASSSSTGTATGKDCSSPLSVTVEERSVKTPVVGLEEDLKDRSSPLSPLSPSLYKPRSPTNTVEERSVRTPIIGLDGRTSPDCSSPVQPPRGPGRCRTRTASSRARHLSTASTAMDSATLDRYKEVPMPRNEPSLSSERPVPYERNFGRSLMADFSATYLSDFVLHGTSEQNFQARMHHDLTMAVQNSVLDERISEAVCLVADTDKSTVKSHTCQYASSGRVRPIEIQPSSLVSSIIQSVYQLAKLKMRPEFCVMHLEDRLQEIYFKSKMLADFIDMNKKIDMESITSTLGVDESDVPLLMAVAGTHSPHLYMGLL